ncbi:MAG: hypothetical protein GY731_11315 [Gammaproteobacteria bacterium]|nr:hypothetical protein [Gammaproteobacteria bacterium]
MDAIECIRTRMSIRKFNDEPVPREVLMEVVNIAKWSPSYKNSQPWETVLLSGARKDELSRLLVGLLQSGAEPSPDLPAPKTWPEVESARIDHLFQQRRAGTGIDLQAPEMVRKSRQANFEFYGAPHVIYLFQDASLSQWSLFDLGLFAQSLMLAARASGLATVPQAFATDYSLEVKDFLNIPETKRLVLGISIGYPDMGAPINSFRTDRARTEEFIKWIE